MNIKDAAFTVSEKSSNTRDSGSDRAVEQRMLRRACVNAQTCQSHRFSHTQSADIDECFDQNLDL